MSAFQDCSSTVIMASTASFDADSAACLDDLTRLMLPPLRLLWLLLVPVAPLEPDPDAPPLVALTPPNLPLEASLTSLLPRESFLGSDVRLTAASSFGSSSSSTSSRSEIFEPPDPPP